MYQLYYQTYFQQKNYPKTIEYADKLIAMDSADLEACGCRQSLARVQANSLRLSIRRPPTHRISLPSSAMRRLERRETSQQLPKPAAAAGQAAMTDEQFNDGKKPALAVFNSVAGQADLQLKDYPGRR